MEENRTDEEMKLRRPRRSKADIEKAIEKAAISQIKKKGFAKSQVTDIVKRAKIEPIVFYNRYKNLEEFYNTFVKRYDYWLSDFTKPRYNKITNGKEFSSALHSLFDYLTSNAMIMELLRWEVAEGSHITLRTAAVHEIDYTDYLNHLTDFFKGASAADSKTISSLLVAGMFFMILHKDRSTFGGIDLNTAEGIQQIKNAMERLGEMLVNRNQTETHKHKLAECLQREGLSNDAIERCIKATYGE